MKITYLLILILALTSCEQGVPPAADTPSDEPVTTVQYSACEEPSEAAVALNNPETIEEAMLLINALPKPLTINCFLEALSRPLRLNASSSILSAQPANGIESPRVFIFKGDLILSIVIGGPARNLLEFAELLTPVRSIKGEVEFPIDEELGLIAPLTRVDFTGKTNCSGCHRSEQFIETIDGTDVYSSIALKPEPDKDVPIVDMARELYLCNFYKSEEDRCKRLQALLGHGDVSQTQFPANMQTFFESLNF